MQSQQASYDAVVVGAGPNGLAAAITLARAGKRVLVLEAGATIGGGMRSAALTLPGFVHDVCSAIHPLAVGSPFFRSVPLQNYGLEWIYPPAAVAHPFDGGHAALIERSLFATGETLGEDGDAYRKLMGPLAASWLKLSQDLLGPLRVPRYPWTTLRFDLGAFLPAALLARLVFRGERARGLFGGLAAHAIQPLEHILTSGFGMMLGMLAHSVGWPLPRGGSQQIADALAAYLVDLGGEIVTGVQVRSLQQLPRTRVVLFDLTPRQLLEIAGNSFPSSYRRQLERFRYGPGVFKVDYALDGAIPWTAPECARAGTVHVGGPLHEIEASERSAWRGHHATRPFVLVAQQSLFDATRAPSGKHTAWAYCHVPHGSTVDMTARVEAQIERFAPGFGSRILAKHVMGPTEMERYNANYVGGDINGGVQDILQFYTRPAIRRVPYSTPSPHLFICSSSTPPGGGVHGMCGYFAARAALRSIG